MNKFNLFEQDLSELYIDKVPINLSPSLSFRSRCEFGYSKNAYTMKDSSKTIYLNKFLYADRSIQELMPKILEIINESQIVKNKLFQINFRTNSKNKILVTLIYHLKVNELLIKTIEEISKKLNVDIIIRSKNFIHATNDNFLEDKLEYSKLNIFQTDNCFYQPNKFLLNRMISKVINFVENPNDLIKEEIVYEKNAYELMFSRSRSDWMKIQKNKLDKLKYATKTMIELGEQVGYK